MSTKLRNLSLMAAALLISVVALSAVAAQDASSTAEPPAATTEASTPAQGQPFLGVQLQDSDNGVTVAQVVDGSAAATAGLQAGDVITALNGTDVKTATDAAIIVHGLKVGDTLAISFTRDGNTMTASATLGAQTQFANPAQPANPPQGQGQGQGQPGRGNRNGQGLDFSYNSADQTWTVGNLDTNSPLYTAGLRQGDVIKTVDGKAYDPMTLFQYIASLGKDGKVTLNVDRAGQTQDIQVSTSDLIQAAMGGMGGFGNFFGRGGNGNNGGFGGMLPFLMNNYGNGYLGVTFQTIDSDIATQNKLTVTDGALITEVAAGSPAEKAGLKVNDVVTAVDGDKVDQERTLRDRMIAYEPGDTVTLTVLRDGTSQDIQATLDQPQMPEMGQFFGGMSPFNGGAPGQTAPQATPETTPNA